MSNYLVITGGSRGIGEATAAHFSHLNWKVINLSRTPCSIPGVKNFNVDLSNPQNIEINSKQILAELQDATTICLVHNAGHQVADTVGNLTLEDMMETLNVNVISSSLLNKLLLPVMNPGSSIIYLGSMLAERGVPSNATYIVSKHAVLGLMRSTCQDLVGKQISTCCICPGLVNTELLKKSMDDDLIGYLLKNYVVGGRLIEPAEIAKVIHNCATSPAINGAVIPVNFGLVAAS